MPDQFHQIDKTVLDRIFELQISLSKQPMSFGHQRVDSFQEFLRFCHWMKPKVETSPSLRNNRNEKHQWVILHMVPYLKVHYLSSTDSFWNWSNLREGDVTQLSSSWRKKNVQRCWYWMKTNPNLFSRGSAPVKSQFYRE